MITNGWWQQWALCAQTSPELFFPESTQSVAARRVCNMCEVAAECLEDALNSQVQYGIRGGLTAHDRSKLRAAINQKNADQKVELGRISEGQKRELLAFDSSHGVSKGRTE